VARQQERLAVGMSLRRPPRRWLLGHGHELKLTHMFNKPSYNIDKAMISGAQAEGFKAWDRRLRLLMSKAAPAVHLFDQRPSALPLNLVGRS
jgi:hypothetical protein